MPTRLVFLTCPDGSASATERMRIDNAGFVGLGTTPTCLLDVNGKLRLRGVEDSQLEFQVAASGQAWRINLNAAGTLYYYDPTNAKFPFKIAPNSGGSLSIATSGIGIGVDAPSGFFHVAQDAELYNIFEAAVGSSAGVNLLLRKARGTQASKTIVSSGDTCGQLFGQGYDGANYQSAALVLMSVDGTPGSGDMPGRITFWTTPDGSTTLAERMRITNKGNVLINTAAVATSATDGFLHIPTCAGTPTGVPNLTTGLVPLIFDTTNSQFWFYTGGAWKQPKTPAGAAIVTWQ